MKRVLPMALMFGACALSSFTAAPLRAQASVSGVVREDSTGKPVAGAVVAFEAIRRQTITDESGKYLLSDLPAGTRLMLVRRLGYIAAGTMVQLVSGETQIKDVTLERVPARLDTVAVVGTATRGRGSGFDGFADRRRLGLGKFIDSTMFRENENRRLEDVLREFTSLKIVSPPSCTQRQTMCSKRIAVNDRGARDACPLQVYLDESVAYRANAADIDWDATYDLTLMSPANLRGAEVYRRASEVPMEFGGPTANCGVLVLWTRR